MTILRSMEELVHTVFVYGSLKQGYGNHAVLGGAIKVADAVTLGRYVLRAGRSFPVVLKAPHDGYVTGEVYRVDDFTLRRLDALEGNGSLYLREKVDLELPNESFISAWLYFGMPSPMWEDFTPVRPDARDRLTWTHAADTDKMVA